MKLLSIFICFLFGIEGARAQQETSDYEDDSKQISIQRVDSKGHVTRFASQKKYQWKFISGGPCFELSFEDEALKDAVEGKISREKNVEAQISDPGISVCLKERSGNFTYRGKVKKRSIRYHYIVDLPFKEPQFIADSKCRKESLFLQGHVQGDFLSVGVRCASVPGGVEYRIESQGLDAASITTQIPLEGPVLHPGQSQDLKLIDANQTEVGQLKLALPAEKKPVVNETRRIFYGDFMLGPAYYRQELSAPFELVNPSISGIQIRGMAKGLYEFSGFMKNVSLAGALRADLIQADSQLWLLDLDLRKKIFRVGENNVSFGLGVLKVGSIGSETQGIQSAWGGDAKLVLAPQNQRWSTQIEYAPIIGNSFSLSSFLLGIGGTYQITPSGLLVGADVEWIHVPLAVSGASQVDCRYTNVMVSIGYRLGTK